MNLSANSYLKSLSTAPVLPGGPPGTLRHQHLGAGKHAGVFFDKKFAAPLLPCRGLGHLLLIVKGTVCVLWVAYVPLCPQHRMRPLREIMWLYTKHIADINRSTPTSHVGPVGRQDLLPGAHTCLQTLQS